MTAIQIPDEPLPGDTAAREASGRLADRIRWHLRYSLAESSASASPHDWYTAVAMTVREHLMDAWLTTQRLHAESSPRTVHYLSLEYLVGRVLTNNAINVGIYRDLVAACDSLGLNWDDVVETERDAGLGNGGLGRLAAGFLDSIATLGLPGVGHGIRYKYGIFRQRIQGGAQVEEPDDWLRYGYPWEIERPERRVTVHFGGIVKGDDWRSPGGTLWKPDTVVVGIPYDTPVAGYHSRTVNTLRLWSAHASEVFNLEFFNNGEYIKAYQDQLLGERISSVLYPNDQIDAGLELRLMQQYFFVACALQDILRDFRHAGHDIRTLADRVVLQLNDTHPALAIPELLRILIDDEALTFEEAWDIVRRTFGYTNHTLMPEALEVWSVDLLERLLPRHMQLVYLVNDRLLAEVREAFPGDQARLQRMSLIHEDRGRWLRMANLAAYASFSVNGVAELHTALLRRHLFKDYAEVWPERFNNKTNGVTPRRWLMVSNPPLTDAITGAIGDGWTSDLTELAKLKDLEGDSAFAGRVSLAKETAKARLGGYVSRQLGVELDLDAMFDVQVKRIHEYKRQVLNVMHILHRYLRIKDGDVDGYLPRTFILGGKAAPGYAMAKLIIRLINDVASLVNRDPAVSELLRVVFLPDYGVSLAQRIMPAADLSEQISTAGTEASGTGNMKLAMNGAVTIGTLDGANIEIRQQVGDDAFFLFGHTVEELDEMRRSGSYDPWQYHEGDADLRRVVDLFTGSELSRTGTSYRPLHDALMTHGDRFFHLADFRSYVDTQEAVDAAYRDRERWIRMAIANIAGSGRFSSDRTIRAYADEIWHLDAARDGEAFG